MLPGQSRGPEPTLTEGLPTSSFTSAGRQALEELRRVLQDIPRKDVRRLPQYMTDDFHGWGIG